MALKIIWSKRAEKSFQQIYDYIEIEWSDEIAGKFVHKSSNVLNLISTNPKMFQEIENTEIRKGHITKQSAVYYKISGSSIYIVTFWDNRKNPNNLKI